MPISGRASMLWLAAFASLHCGSTTLASDQDSHGVVAIDATHVYWVNSDTNTVMKVAKSGGAVVTLTSQSENESHSTAIGLALEATSIYWNREDGTLKKAPLGGGSTVTLDRSSGQSRVGIALDSSGIYWAPAGDIIKVPLDGGAPSTVVSLNATLSSLVVAGKRLCWSTNEFSGLHNVVSMALTGGTPVTIAADLPGERLRLAADDTNVYWTSWSDNVTVVKMPFAGGGPIPLASNRNRPMAIAVDATAVYWTEETKGLMKVPLGGGAVVTLATTGTLGSQIAIDASSVYWITFEGGSGSILKTAK